MRQRQNPIAIDLLIVTHIAGDDVKPHIDAAEKGLDLDHFGDITGRIEEFVERAGIGLVEREAK